MKTEWVAIWLPKLNDYHRDDNGRVKRFRTPPDGAASPHEIAFKYAASLPRSTNWLTWEDYDTVYFDPVEALIDELLRRLKKEDL